MKISYELFHSTCESFAKEALGSLIKLSAGWKPNPTAEPVPEQFKDETLHLIFYDSMAEFLISTIVVEPPTKS